MNAKSLSSLLVASCWLWMPAGKERVLHAETPTRPPRALASESDSAPRSPRATATIHWRRVTLREAVERLKALFHDPILVDRRVDPYLRVDLDVSATSTEQVLRALAPQHELGVTRLRRLVYLGPASSAQQLPSLVAQQSQRIARLPREVRALFVRRQPLRWQRLSEPRQLIESIVEASGGHILNAERVPFDLWDANELAELSLAESLAVLLIGFDLSFELHAEERSVEITPLIKQANHTTAPLPATKPRGNGGPRSNPDAAGTRQVYTLRVQEKPVGAVLRELASRLNWSLQIDEEAIRAAGKSLDTRVSFAVENADRERLLDALLTPAGLECLVNGNTIRVVPRRYSN